MSFRTYMSNVLTSGLPLGYFAQNPQEHADLPDAKTWEELEAHLTARQADPVVITSAAGYWQDYHASGTFTRYIPRGVNRENPSRGFSLGRAQ